MPLNFMAQRLRSLPRQDLLMADGKIATFTGNAVEDAQYAFFPTSKAEKRWEDCHFNVIGQVIDANAPLLICPVTTL